MDRITRSALAFVSLTALLMMGSSAPVELPRLVTAPNMHDLRADHTSTLLPDGRVLIAGGMVENGVFLNSAELYDPVKGTFVTTGSMQSRRVGHTATLLPNGKVLIAGGLAGRVFEGGPGVVATTEIYDPATGRFTPGPAMNARRDGHMAMLLQNGKVLIVGGADTGDRPLASAEIYDPASGRFTPSASMQYPRAARAGALLKDGRVLVTGGSDEGRRAVALAEIFDPRTATWQAVGNMTSPREKHAATLLADGRVLITGGSPNDGWSPLRTAEVFDPRTNKFTAISDMALGRFKLPNAVVTLKNGEALVAGGAAEVEVYDVGAGKFVRAGSLDGPHYFASATLLRDGRVLITGGYGTGAGRSNGPLSSDRAWVYQP
jgi:galactose oxidase-like protein/Kelch motif protein